MVENVQVSRASVQRFLRDRWGSGIRDVAPLESGAWSSIYAFERSGRQFVIRWSAIRENFERDALAATFSRRGLPVPQVIELGRGPDGFYAISPFVEGDFLESLATPALEAALPSILDMFAALRSVDLSGTQGFGHWDGNGTGEHGSWKEFLLAVNTDPVGSLNHGWKANLERSPLGTESFDRLYERLEDAARACPEERYLNHSDLINRNVLVKGREISAVLDWGSSILGDPLYDIAWFVFYEPWYPNFTEVDLPRRIIDHFLTDPATNKCDIDTRLRAYRLHIGLDSIAYNASRSNWVNANEAADYTLRTTS